MHPDLTSVTAQQTGLELGKRSRSRWETLPGRRPVSGAITWQDIDLNDASRKSWLCLPLHDSPLMTDRDAMSERGSILSSYEARCEHGKYGHLARSFFPIIQKYADQQEITGPKVIIPRRMWLAWPRGALAPEARLAPARVARGTPMPTAAGCGDARSGSPIRYSVVAAGRFTGPAIPGDWLSGRAPRSHRGGHWFDPSIAHQV